MKPPRFEVVFGLILLAGFRTFQRWQSPGCNRGKLNRGKLTAADVERYMAAIQTLDAPADVKPEFLVRIRKWMESDDGAPFYNLNVMRFRSQPEAEASNAHYEKLVAPMLLKIGAFPTFSGNVRQPNLVGYGDMVDNWNRIVIVRYPSRRALLDLLTDPEYQRAEPYKLTALDQLLLVPTSGQLVLPDATWLVGAGCIIAFLAAGWVRATRR